jgi:hypothetical protein
MYPYCCLPADCPCISNGKKSAKNDDEFVGAQCLGWYYIGVVQLWKKVWKCFNDYYNECVETDNSMKVVTIQVVTLGIHIVHACTISRILLEQQWEGRIRGHLSILQTYGIVL